MSETYDLVISYTDVDGPSVLLLAEQLEARGFRLFLSNRDIQAGDIPFDRIGAAIEGTRHGALAISSAGLADAAVKAQYLALLEQVTHTGQRLIPILLEPIPPTALPIFLRMRKPLNLYADIQAGSDAWIARLMAALERPSTGATAGAPATLPSEAAAVPPVSRPSTAPWTPASEVRVAVLTASPLDGAPLLVTHEIRELQKLLTTAGGPVRIVLDLKPAAREDDLREVLLEGSADIIHFSGHNLAKEGLVFEGEGGVAEVVPADRLRRYFSLAKGVRGVVLNACKTQAQAEAIAEHVDFVIGTSSKILDGSGQAFAFGLYRALAHGHRIDQAFNWARLHLPPHLARDEQNFLLITRPEAPAAQ